MRVFAIDPGPVRSAYVGIDDCGRLHVFAHGKLGNHVVLEMVDAWSQSQAVAIERVRAQGKKPVGNETFETAEWSGRFFEATNGRPFWITRIAAVRHVVGADLGTANADSLVRRALIERFGPKGTKKQPGPTYDIANDEWQALAVAVTLYDQLKGGTK